jgi:hypothetical protein
MLFPHPQQERTNGQQLMLQINVIREKATEAEVIVKGITQDIQRLDVAKRNLTGAIQTAERWGMLSTSTFLSLFIFIAIQGC